LPWLNIVMRWQQINKSLILGKLYNCSRWAWLIFFQLLKNIYRIDLMEPSRHIRSKNTPNDWEKYSFTKKIKTISFFKYWNDNILDLLGSTQVNLSNLLPRSWNSNNPIESKLKKNYKTKFSINPMLKNEIEN